MTTRVRFLLISLALATAAAVPLRAQTSTGQAITPSPASIDPAATAVLRRDVGHGIYEMAYSPLSRALYVASAESVSGVKGGVVYKLDPNTLETVGATHTDLRNFGLAMTPEGDTLYATNSLEHAITAIDVKTGAVKQRLAFGDLGPNGKQLGVREVVFDPSSKMLYIGGVGDPGKIWVVDGRTMALRSTISDAGKWVTGLLLAPEENRLYAANGSGEILVIDTRVNRIISRWAPDDGKQYLFVNVALDPKTHRLFVTDDSQQKTVLVFDTTSGKVIRQIPLGDSLGIKFNPVRNELYVTHREGGRLSVLDATTYQLKQVYPLPPHPNSLLVAPDGQSVYVTVKQEVNQDFSTTQPDSIVRVSLH